MKIIALVFVALFFQATSLAVPNYAFSLKRAAYLLNGRIPADGEFQTGASSDSSYKSAIRNMIEDSNFYDAVLRYHERALGVGLPLEYLEDLQLSTIEGREKKFAKITCEKGVTSTSRFRCYWSGQTTQVAQCPAQWEQPAAAFWKPGLVVWACPSIIRACGSDLAACFIQYADEDVARNTEFGTSEVFDSRFAIIKSLSRQSAGIATAVAVENYPYTKILEPGLTAVDGALAHFYKQGHHFDLNRLHLPQAVTDNIEKIRLTDPRFKLIYAGSSYESAGVISTFGYLRRYEKNRTRANQLYERLLCRQFTSELPRVFPQDPGNLRTAPGCSGCHSTLDPLADFFSVWGEGGELYSAVGAPKSGSFLGQTGTGLHALANIVRNDNAFATCTVQNVWYWLMGRKFYASEANLRTALTNYFVTTKYSFKELVYALATHSAFTEHSRTNATVTDPLDQPPVGTIPDASTTKKCETGYTWAKDIQPKIAQCTSCHVSGTTRQSLETESAWNQWGSQAVGMMASGNMPPGQTGAPASGPVYDLKEAARCWLEENK